MTMTLEYKLISEHYGNRVATRSQVRLINHINEGLIVLDYLGASENAKKAFCIHPLIQGDVDLFHNGLDVCATCSPIVVMLAMEYRSVANEFLSDKIPSHQESTIRLSPLREVNDMLIADKVQNYKDFELYHLGTHARSNDLDVYFRKWLEALGVGDIMYTDLFHKMKG